MPSQRSMHLLLVAYLNEDCNHYTIHMTAVITIQLYHTASFSINDHYLKNLHCFIVIVAAVNFMHILTSIKLTQGPHLNLPFTWIYPNFLNLPQIKTLVKIRHYLLQNLTKPIYHHFGTYTSLFSVSSLVFLQNVKPLSLFSLGLLQKYHIRQFFGI